MKHFKCIALDKHWQQCMGTFSAPDAEEARRKLFSQGYSIIQLKEIAESEASPRTDFFLHPQYPLKNRQTRKDAEQPGQESINETPQSQKKSIAVLLILCAAVAAVGVASVFFLQPQKKAEPLPPQSVVRSYLTLGFRGNWTAQYAHLSPVRAEYYFTAENYAKQMQGSWLGFPSFVPEASTGGTQGSTIPPAEVTLAAQYGANAEVSATVLFNNAKRRFFFLLRFDGVEWKITYIRDVLKVEANVRFLALNPQGPRREAVMNEMRTDFGLTGEEIADLVREYHLRHVEEELQQSIESNKALQEQKKAEKESPSYAEPYDDGEQAEVNAVALEVEQKMKSIMDMVDSFSNEEPRVRR